MEIWIRWINMEPDNKLLFSILDTNFYAYIDICL